MDVTDPLSHDELTYLLGLAFQLTHSEFVSRVHAISPTDLRPVHAMLFQVLGQHGATSTELAARLGVTKQATGQILDFLERQGYVTREPHPEGGRRRLVMMTDKAVNHLKLAGGVLNELESELSDQLGQQNIDLLRQELVRLIRHLAGDTLPPLRPIW
ncbi:MAG TPA: MarR family transcriptional regulator [Candidatus Limnocylindrales bacterium]|nr:MarR family transcriptional regulator [Candidatus Limnocylindrales bacterium]